MRFLIQKILPHFNYTFIIGTTNQSDSLFKERVENDINTAMANFKRHPDVNHSVATVMSDAVIMGEPEIPILNWGAYYLIFGLLNSQQSTAFISDSDIAEQQASIAKAFEASYESKGNKGRLAVVVLYDCTVRIIPSTKKPSKGVYF